jgi:hypothetical protein
MRRRALIAVVALVFGALPLSAEETVTDHVIAHVTKNAAEQLLGITPVLANTPFLGLATLCGLAVLSDSQWITESNSTLAKSVRHNALISQMRPYASGWLFAFLIIVALLTYAANSGKIQGIVGKLVHLLEAVTVLCAYIFLSTTVLRGLPKSPPPAIAEMSAFSVTTGVLLGVTACLALGAMMLVRLAIGFAVWLIPIPFVDFAFETVKKVFTVVMIGIYLFNPLLATIIAIALIALSLIVAGWAWRLLMFVGRIIVFPRIGLALGHRSEKRVVLPASALGVRGFRRRESAILAVTEGEIHLFRRSTDTAPSLSFATQPVPLVLVRGVWWSELREIGSNGAIVSRVAFGTAAFESIHSMALPLGVTVDHSKLALWLGSRPSSRPTVLSQ